MAISEYVEHYHAKWNHQGLDKALIAPGLEVATCPDRCFGVNGSAEC